jgi:hypothetical protein
MRIEADAVLRYPREVVFAAYRDDLPAFVGFMPNLRAIEVVEREERGDVVRLHNVMHGATELPANLAQRLEERFLSWDDWAVWDQSTWSCEWQTETHAFRDAVRCRGRSDFIDLGGDRTRLEMTGELAIELDRVKGVPSFLAGSLGRTAEAFVVRQVTANLVAVSDALAAFLSEDTVA